MEFHRLQVRIAVRCLALISLTLCALGSFAGAAEPAGSIEFRQLGLGAVGSSGAAERQQFDSHLDEVIAAYRLDHGLLPASGWEAQVDASSALLPTRFTIYPFAGVLDEDIHPYDYVDLDPTAGVQDWDCSEHSYDGHDAVDFWLRSFGEQDVGVAAFAPLAGEVIHAQDGYPDRQRQCSPNTENYVIVDHGGGLTTAYGHLARGSVRVANGDRVEAGEELGRIASSGCSYWPHLHFRTKVGDRVVEPHAGPCNPGASGWRNQRPLRHGIHVWDLGFTHKDPERLKAKETPPEPLPRLGRIGRKDKRVYLWAYVLNLEPQTPVRVRAYRPDGSLGYDSGTLFTQNNETLRREIGWLAVETRDFRGHWGTWTFELSMDGEVIAEAPLEVGKKKKRKLNRAPVTPERVVFEPKKPKASAPIVCVAKVDHLIDDPDYDIVGYFFEWKVEGQVVRERTWAARSDVLPARTIRSGETLRCTVVPHDGRAVGEATTAEVVVR